jgi:S1-C subfamily serine protease
MAVHKKRIILAIALAAWLPSVAFALSPAQVYERVQDSVVVVTVGDPQGQLVSSGSGVVLPSGDVITNYHVVEAGVRYTVGRGKHIVPATLKAGDPDKDLCLLHAPGLVAEPARLGRADRLKVGDPVYAVGAPQGLELSLSEGIVSQLRGGGPYPIIQTTVAISPGSSGGGLFNAKGELVGITTFRMKGEQSLNFALPVEWIGEVAVTTEKRFPYTGRIVPLKPFDTDDRFTKARNGVISDNATDLEWYVGPDQVTWYQTKAWAENLTAAGGGWRMPTLPELKAIWQQRAGIDNRGQEHLIDTWVWSGQLINASSVRIFNFESGQDSCSSPGNASWKQAFAMRSRRR